MVLLIALGLLLVSALALGFALRFMLLATFRAATFKRCLFYLVWAGTATSILALAFSLLWGILGQINVNFGGGRPSGLTWFPILLVYMAWTLVLLIRWTLLRK